MRLLTFGLLSSFLAVAAGAQTHPAHFDRSTVEVALQSSKSMPRTGMVTRHSLAIAACRTAAARYGKLVGNDLRLLDRHTFMVSGTIVPATGGAAREIPDPVRKPQQFTCKVTDTGQVLDHSIGNVPARKMTAVPPKQS